MRQLTTVILFASTLLFANTGFGEFTSTVTLNSYRGDYTISGTNRSQTLTPDGLGGSYSLSHFNDETGAHWSFSVEAGEQTDSASWNNNPATAIDYDQQFVTVLVSFSEGPYWFSVLWQNSDTELEVRNQNRTQPIQRVQESSDENTLSAEIGHDWQINNWTLGLGANLAYQKTRVHQIQQGLISEEIKALLVEEENIDGVDATVTGQLNYFYPVSDSSALSPSVNLAYQYNISGELTSISNTRINSGRQVVQNSSARQSGDLDEDNEAYLGFSLSYILDNWLTSLSYYRPLLNEPKDAQWQISLSYQFD